MRLLEYEAKQVFREYGIKTPEGVLCRSPMEVKEAVARLGESVIKAQVPVGGRGLAGGVRFTGDPEEAVRIASELFERGVRGYRVDAVLVEKKVCVNRELYLSVTVDRSAKSIVYLASRLGGVEIEELAKKKPEEVLKINLDPFIGYSPFVARTIASFIGLPQSAWGEFERIAVGLYRIMIDYDAELVEINPLVVDCGGSLVALDAKILVDDNSLYRHPALAGLKSRELTEEERSAKEKGFTYVSLDGYIGVIGNGAGLTMATMDLIEYYGGKPANFLDVWSGGGASRDRVKEAVKLLLENPRVKVVLVNIFGGMTRCDEVAMGVRQALEEASVKKPIVVRLMGTNQEEGARILREIGLDVYEDVDEAVRKAVELARG
ncbi:ADP-forming succinate--CoA ligase subunit beta [Thermogladius sp.]|uniref:ADP-forming succinate--CoA ligase subunit beta n=1 Tax=Thermogladius sp. TaxID=2023064 RepID=UPI003D0ED8FF